MANRPSRIEISIPTASADGKFYGRYPKGDAPVGSGALAGAAISTSAASASLGSLPRVTTVALPGAQLSVPYSFQLAASGGTPPYTWVQVSIAPNTGGWASVNSSGVLGGTPGTAETETVTVHAVDSLGVPSANAVLPLAVAATGAFDYYISTTGSNSNPGTVASPWAISAINAKQATYAGKRLGLIAGTYDVSSLMTVNEGLALNINGGTVPSPTYVASCDASGNYSARAATLDAKGASGVYGGGNANQSGILGQQFEYGTIPPNKGNWTLDGITFTGFSNWAVWVGGFDGSGGNCPNVIIQNCLFTGGSAATTSGTTGRNLAALVLFSFSNCLVQNCKWLNNAGGSDNIHFTSIYIWGQGGGSSNATIQLCSFINSGGVYVKTDNGKVTGTIIQQNYFDQSTKTPSGGQVQGPMGISQPTSYGISSYVRNNIVYGGSLADMTEQLIGTGYDCMHDPFFFYNNTWIAGPGFPSGAGSFGARMFTQTASAGLLNFYNNLMYDPSNVITASYGYLDATADGFNVLDYNIYGNGNLFNARPAGDNVSGTSKTLATWKTATGKDAHSIANSANPFTSGGSTFPSLAYQVASGSPAFQAGHVGGISAGAACNVGAWDGTVTQIGCNQ